MFGGNTLKIIISAVDKTGAAFNSAVAKMDKMSASMKSAGRKMSLGITLPLMAAGAASIHAGLDFSKAIGYANTMMKLSTTQMKEFEGQVLNLSDKYGKSASDIATAAYSVSSVLHTNEKDTTKILKSLTRAAKAGKISVTDAGNAIIRIMSIYNIDAKNADSLTDTLAATIKAGNANWQDLASILPQVAGNTKMLGISIEETAAAFAAMSSNAGSSAMAGTALRAVVIALAKPSNEMRHALKHMGYDTAQAAIKAIGFSGILKNLGSKYGSNAEMIAKLIPNIRGMAGFVGLTSEKGKSLAEALDIVKKKAGELDAQMKAGETSYEKYSEAMNRIRNTGIRLFLVIEPYITSLMNKISLLTEKINKMSPAGKKLAITFGLIAAAVGPVLILISNMIPALKALPILIKAVGASLTFLAANPLYLVAAAIAVIIIDIGIFIKKLDALGNKVDGFGNAWKLVISDAEAKYLHFELKVLEGVNRIAKYIPGISNVSALSIKIVKKEIEHADEAFNKVANSIRRTNDKAKDLSSTEKSVADDTKAMGGAIAKAGDTMSESFKKGVAAIKQIRSEIKDAYDEMAGNNKDYTEKAGAEQKSFRGKIVDLVVSADNKIDELQTQLAVAQARHNEDEVASLRRKIAAQKAIVQRYRTMDIDLSKDIIERKRYLAMDEMSRLVEDHQKKLLMIKKEYLEKQIASLKKLVLLAKEHNTAVRYIGIEKTTAINAEIEKEKTFREKLKEKTDGLKTWMENTKVMYKNYVSSINSILSGVSSIRGGGAFKSYQFGTDYVPATGPYLLHQGEQVIPRNRAGGVTVNINGGTYLSPDVAEQIGDMIAGKLKLQFNF